jgi:hypothetical protein
MYDPYLESALVVGSRRVLVRLFKSAKTSQTLHGHATRLCSTTPFDKLPTIAQQQLICPHLEKNYPPIFSGRSRPDKLTANCGCFFVWGIGYLELLY